MDYKWKQAAFGLFPFLIALVASRPFNFGIWMVHKDRMIFSRFYTLKCFYNFFPICKDRTLCMIHIQDFF